MKCETINGVELDAFVRAYIECALWSSTDEKGEPLDSGRDAWDLDASALQSMVKECADFRDLCGELLDCQTDEQNGHDFWLTRNGHGAGFWDRGLGEAGRALTANAKSFGSSDIYAGDDGKIYVS